MSANSPQEFESSSDDLSVRGQRIALIGKFGGMSQRELRRLLRDRGAICVDRPTATVDLVVIGADELPLDEDLILDDSVRDAAATGHLEIIGETRLWERLGLVEATESERLYTPAMLAELLGVSVALVRRWHRRGLILPVRDVHRLPYFDFREVATARQLAQLLSSGMAPETLERKLGELARYVPDVERPLAQLSVILHGKQLLLRQEGGLVEPGGQLRIDFDAIDPEQDRTEPHAALTLPVAAEADRDADTPDRLLQAASQLEESGHLEGAADCYRAALAARGPTADICFQLADLLYRLGDLSAARERYYMAIELDEDYVEARANLGCVLAETGQHDLALAAFQGALRFHPEYPDVHYHVAQLLDELGQPHQAEDHWREFLRLAPDSPWSDQARLRLESPGNSDNPG